MDIQELANYIAPFLAPARRIAEITNTKPEAFTYKNHRTYYLGANGRVSQRKQLVGEIIATVRACTTDHARFLFTEARQDRKLPIGTPKPFIGEAVLCKCGWHRAKNAECSVCSNWASLAGSVQTAPSQSEVVR